MEVNQIIANLFQDKRVDQTVSKFSKPCNADDLKQDVFMALLGKDPTLILDLDKRGMLFFYTTSVIKNISLKNKKKPAMCELGEVADNQCADPDYMAAFDNLPHTEEGVPYHKEIVKAVVKYGSVYRTAKILGIPVSSFRRDVLFVRSFLKARVC